MFKTTETHVEAFKDKRAMGPPYSKQVEIYRQVSGSEWEELSHLNEQIEYSKEGALLLD